jgi:integrase
MTETAHDGGHETMAAVPGTPHLFVRTYPSGITSYLFRYRKEGHSYKTTLHVLTLEAAIKATQVYIGEIALGIDPIAKRKAEEEQRLAAAAARRAAKTKAAQEKDFTVQVMVDTWAAARGKDGKDDKRTHGYIASTKAALERALGPVLDLPARDLNRDRIEKLIAAVERRGPAAAARAHTAVSMAFSRAIRLGKLEINPCTALERPKPVQRPRILSAIEVGRVWRGAGTLPAPLGAFVRFLLATATRRNEVLGARWSEIDGDVWHIPASRMKAKRDFTVPLTRAALLALPSRGTSDLIFSRDGVHQLGGLGRIKTALDAAIESDGAGPLLPFTLHDFRRAFATWVCDRGVDYVVANLALAHAIPLDRTGRTYVRSYKIAERRAALDLWSSLLEPEPIRKGRKTQLRVVA